MSGSTFITKDLDPEIQKKIDADRIENDRKWDLALMICECTIAAYSEGEITKTTAIDYIVKSLAVPKADMARIPAIYRAFYHDKLIDMNPKQRTLASGRSDPNWIKQLALYAISRSQKDGFTVNRDLGTEKSAFILVEKLFQEAGFFVPASTIVSWYATVRKKGKKAKIAKKIE